MSGVGHEGLAVVEDEPVAVVVGEHRGQRRHASRRAGPVDDLVTDSELADRSVRAVGSQDQRVERQRLRVVAWGDDGEPLLGHRQLAPLPLERGAVEAADPLGPHAEVLPLRQLDRLWEREARQLRRQDRHSADPANRRMSSSAIVDEPPSSRASSAGGGSATSPTDWIVAPHNVQRTEYGVWTCCDSGCGHSSR